MGYSGTGCFSQSGGSNAGYEWTLYLGYNFGSSGTYQLSGNGLLPFAGLEYVGYSGTGLFTQSDGNNNVTDYLFLGYNSGSSGTYQLGGNGRLTAQNEDVGYSGTGLFTQSDGDNTVRTLLLGSSSGSSGTYQLSGSGRLDALNENVGDAGTGLFIQSGGNNTAYDSLILGRASGSSGTYELSGNGCLTAHREYVGYSGTGLFTQSDGNNTVSSELFLAYSPGSSGIYQLSENACLTARYEFVGYRGTGTFTQTGGTNVVYSLGVGPTSGTYQLIGSACLTAGSEGVGGLFTQTDGNNMVSGSLYVGPSDAYSATFGGTGAYQLSGCGRLTAASEYVARYGTALFQQSGGQNTTGYLSLGTSGRYEMCGGTLTVNGRLDGNGVFAILDANAKITIAGAMSIGPKGSLFAVPGTVIHMIGSAFVNQSTDANALAGMGNLRLIYEGLDSNVVDPFEVAGRDLGADAGGFVGNFGLAALQLGGDGGPGHVILVDLFDNQSDSNAAEALYLQSLIVNPGSELCLNGLHLYVNGVLVNAGDGALYGGGEVYALPEPATLSLLAVGGLALLGRRGRR